MKTTTSANGATSWVDLATPDLAGAKGTAQTRGAAFGVTEPAR